MSSGRVSPTSGWSSNSIRHFERGAQHVFVCAVNGIPRLEARHFPPAPPRNLLACLAGRTPRPRQLQRIGIAEPLDRSRKRELTATQKGGDARVGRFVSFEQWARPFS